jgi:hypothetical protein
MRAHTHDFADQLKAGPNLLLRALSLGRLTVVWETKQEKPRPVPTAELIPTKRVVHNHGPSEGRGLDCGERRMPDGSLRGHCLDEVVTA